MSAALPIRKVFQVESPVEAIRMAAKSDWNNSQAEWKSGPGIVGRMLDYRDWWNLPARKPASSKKT